MQRFIVPLFVEKELSRLIRVLHAYKMYYRYDHTEKYYHAHRVSLRINGKRVNFAIFCGLFGEIALFNNKITLFDKLSVLNSALNALYGKYCMHISEIPNEIYPVKS